MSNFSLVSRFVPGFALCLALSNSNAALAAANSVAAKVHKAINVDSVAPIEGEEGVAVRLTAPKKVQGSIYRWDLNGDNTYETRGRVIDAVFPDNGTYNVRYRISPPPLPKLRGAVRKSKSKVYTGRRQISVSNLPPSADVGGPYDGVAGRSVRFHGSATDRGPEDRRAGYIYSWNFGDGTAVNSGADLSAPTHTFANAGTYTVVLRTKDKDAATSSASQTTVTIGSAGSTPPPGTTATPTPQPTASGPLKTVRPQEIQGILANPGMGWQSADKVNTSGQDSNGLPNKVAYIKYYWKDLETGNGVYNWSTFDQRLSQAHNSGQKVAFRIVVVDNITSAPTWLRDAGAAGTWIRYYGDGGNPPQVWSPTLSDPIFQQKHFEFLHELGRRYNGHPDVDSVDIGTVGVWGEWHFWAVTPTIPTPSAATMRAIIDKYVESFPNTPLVQQLENATGLAYAVSKGTGYRGDCIGNVDNQMPYLYEPNIATAHAQDAWQHGPIQFETCWDIRHWVDAGWNLRYIMDWMLSHHVSSLNNKNAAVPASAMAEVQRLLTKMGYRYVLRELRHPQKAHAGNLVTLSMDWENIGVAPSYGRYVLAMQLRNLSGNVVATQATQNAIKNWMPGALAVDEGLALPTNIAPGTYTIALAMVDPSSGQPQIRLAISGRENSGWYPVSTITIE